MVDAVVSYAVKKLGDFLIQQEIEGEVQWLQRELRLLRPYLKDAEQKQDSDEKISTWISEIQNIAYDTEDIIESFIFKVNNEQIHSGIEKDIKNLKERVREISRQRETYCINDLGITQNIGTSSRDLRIITSYGCEDLDVVGFEDDFQILKEKLIDDIESRTVISISGMDGLGKSTHARKLYNDNKRVFTLHAWICRSQYNKIEDLLRKLISSFYKQLTKKMDKMELSELVAYLRNPLMGHRYLVVIDGLWSEYDWKSIKKALPDNNSGSRIIITTQLGHVALLSGDVAHVHNLRRLRDDESWSLFCKKAFSDRNNVCPDDLETLGKEMTKKCGGLPLAISVLGGLLSRKEFHEWPMVNEHLREVKEDAKEFHVWRMVKEPFLREVKKDAMSVITQILDLSYNDLPINIKSCFLYLGIFPEDALIDVEQLMQLWIAEGFIPIDEEGRTPEEVSQCYFKELLGRNLVQSVKQNWRMTSKCRVHDLLRHPALIKARKTNFLLRVEGGTSFLEISFLEISTGRRHAQRCVVHLWPSFGELCHSGLFKKTRTLYLLNLKGSSYYKENRFIDFWEPWELWICSFSLLRVLQLERVDLRDERKSSFFNAVEKMIHLRYLGLKNTNVDELPSTIGNLEVLQTLNLKSKASFTPIKLPNDICKLKELRHLMGKFWEEDFPNLEGVDNVQTLELLIERRTRIESVFDSSVFATLSNLTTVRIGFSALIIISIEPLLSCEQLIELKITGEGKVREMSKDIHKYLTKLKYLELFLSESEDDPIPKLEMLPNLLVLHLTRDTGKTKRWTFSANGFPQLEFLKLGNALNMELQVEEEAMPRLRFLCLEDDDLKETLFPERFWSLPGEEAMNWKFHEY